MSTNHNKVTLSWDEQTAGSSLSDDITSFFASFFEMNQTVLIFLLWNCIVLTKTQNIIHRPLASIENYPFVVVQMGRKLSWEREYHLIARARLSEVKTKLGEENISMNFNEIFQGYKRQIYFYFIFKTHMFVIIII